MSDLASLTDTSDPFTEGEATVTLPSPTPTQEIPVLKPGSIGNLQISSVADTPFNFNLLVYGKSGVGKTRFAGSAALIPSMSPVLFIDIEGGTFSIRELYPGVHVVRVTSFDELQEVYDYLFEGNHPYKTCVVDSLTETQKFSMAGIMLKLIQKEPDRDPDIPSVREWGKNIEQIRRFVRAFRDLPINTIFTALAQEVKNGKTGAIEKKPYLNGKLADEVSGFLDIVMYYYNKPVDGQSQRLLLSMATEDVIAKDRSDRLPPVIMMPTMQDIFDYVSGARNKDEAA
jgi:AAA domain